MLNKSLGKSFLGLNWPPLYSGNICERISRHKNRDAYLLGKNKPSRWSSMADRSQILGYLTDLSPLNINIDPYQLRIKQLRPSVHHVVLGSGSKSDRASQRKILYDGAKSELHSHRAHLILIPWGIVTNLRSDDDVSLREARTTLPEWTYAVNRTKHPFAQNRQVENSPTISFGHHANW